MKLDQSAFNKLAAGSHALDRVEKHFASFAKALEFFDDPGCPLKGVTAQLSQNNRAVAVRFRGYELIFTLNLVIAESGAVAGRIDVTKRTAHQEREALPVDSFSIAPNGSTGFEPLLDGDMAEIDHAGIHIVSTYLLLVMKDA
jgi:hypothetical protein